MEHKESVKEYYGQRLTSSNDLITTGVTSCIRKRPKLPAFITDALAEVHEDISNRAYGCATVYPEALENAHVLDLGSGCGRDCFVLSRVIGEQGGVVGLDMTDELLSLSRGKIDYHTKKFGYAKPNVQFVKGYMEKMEEAGLKENFFDVIVSNCVISLCRDKRAVLKQACRVLKPGGELFFSDMYRDGQLPDDVMGDEKLWCEGLIGALTYQELHSIAKEHGFSVPRVVKADTLPVVDEAVKARLGKATYAAVTYRLFKKSPGQVTSGPCEATYKGGIRGYDECLKFDHANSFQKGTPKVVDGELATTLITSRFAQYFDLKPVDEGTTTPSLDVDPFGLFSQDCENGRS